MTHFRLAAQCQHYYDSVQPSLRMVEGLAEPIEDPEERGVYRPAPSSSGRVRLS